MSAELNDVRSLKRPLKMMNMVFVLAMTPTPFLYHLVRNVQRSRDVPRLLLHRVPTVSRTSAVDFVDAYLQHEGRAAEICSSSIRMFRNDNPWQSMTELVGRVKDCTLIHSQYIIASRNCSMDFQHDTVLLVLCCHPLT